MESDLFLSLSVLSFSRSLYMSSFSLPFCLSLSLSLSFSFSVSEPSLVAARKGAHLSDVVVAEASLVVFARDVVAQRVAQVQPERHR